MLRAAQLAAAVAASMTAATASAATVHLRGTAYEFNNTKLKLGGAQIRVAEDPTLGATAAADGTYDLKVPSGRSVTPYVNAAGHHTIYLQTFTTVAGRDLERVNFQTPSDAIYGALAALLQVPVGADGNPVQCAIVSTFSTRDVRDLDYDAFVGYGAHGVAGATASATPALPAPVYFNKDVIPDRSQPMSSADGGVIWPVVPAGRYTIKASHPTSAFAPFTATCAPGRVVNANPPWGVHQLGLTNPTKYSAGWDGPRPRTLKLTRLPPRATVVATCAGRGCPFTSRTLARESAHRTLDLRAKLGRRLRAGQTLGVTVTAHAYDGVRLSWRLRTAGAATTITATLPLGG
ncbi:hypothetical protein DSM104299_05738 [Baekduia alba]|uniref:hypothetical protein n=1 Tax=Baekduia alba TaxID=2997333 RepID=UPI002340E8B7|nr:hypothetical protein [Baekduia alba]WCB96968.1 hypothetical protein DSM104299_05738 [Baekduia alba]